VSAFRVKLGTNDLNCVDVPLNPTHTLTHVSLGHLPPRIGIAQWARHNNSNYNLLYAVVVSMNSGCHLAPLVADFK